MAGPDARRRPGRLGVGVIGAGKVGAVLGAALRSAGHAVVGVTAVSAASRERAESLLPGVPVLEVRDIVERAELVVLAVPDDALPELVEGLASLGAWQAGQLVMHTSGRYGISVLAPARAAGAIPLAIHPAMTFTGLSLDLGRLTDSTFGITAPAAVLPIAQALVVEMGADPVVVEEESRALYHAALAHSSNHLVTIAAQSAQLLGDIGVQHPDRMLGPLMKASLENALSSGEGALTGPVARGDAGTVTAHRAALESHDAPDVRQAYLGMARATAVRALDRDVLTASQGAVILAALADPTTDDPSTTEAVAALGPPREPLVVRTADELRAATTSRLSRGSSGSKEVSLGLVPTMGGLHAGHATLVRAAREANDVVVVSIFVNPLQFGDSADLARYPRTLDADLQLLAEAGADIVFAPAVEDMYPGGEPLVRLSAGRMGEVLEGASRPGHFDGMLTVVAKLLNIGRPAVAARYRAYFGEKDAQQLALVRRMVLDLDVPVRIEGVPTVRAYDGLALSSRNRFLADDERAAALVLPRVLAELRAATERGVDPDLDQARATIAAVDGVELDYLEIVDPASFTPPGDEGGAGGGTLAVVAAKVGAVRLIDNTLLPPATR